MNKCKNFVLSVFMVLILSACGAEKDGVTDTSKVESSSETINLSEIESSSETEIESKSETEIESKSETEIENRSETESKTENLYSNLSESDMEYITEKMSLSSFADSIDSALNDIGFQKITDVRYEKVDMSNGNDIDLDIAITDIDGKVILVKSDYLSVLDKWAVMSIRDYENGNYYWGSSIVDIYDYNTGEIASEKSDFRTADEIIDDYNSECEKIEQDFEQSLDDIVEKYGLQR